MPVFGGVFYITSDDQCVPVKNITVIGEDGRLPDEKTITDLFSFLSGADRENLTNGFNTSDWLLLGKETLIGHEDGGVSEYVLAYRSVLRKEETTSAVFNAAKIKNYLEGELNT